jgi:hypothetical protein
MTRFSDWPAWLQTLVVLPHAILGFVALVAKIAGSTTQIWIRGGVPARLLSRHALRLQGILSVTAIFRQRWRARGCKVVGSTASC